VFEQELGQLRCFEARQPQHPRQLFRGQGHQDVGHHLSVVLNDPELRLSSIALKDNMIAAGCTSGTIKLFALQQSGDWGQVQSESPLKVDTRINCLEFSPDGKVIAAGDGWISDHGQVRLYDVVTGTLLGRLLKVDAYVDNLDVSPCATQIVAMTNNWPNKKYENKNFQLQPAISRLGDSICIDPELQ